MKISMILEALDKASRPLKAMMKANQAANAAAVKGAEKTAAATQKTVQSYNAAEKAATSAGRAAASAGAQAAKGAEQTAAANAKVAASYKNMEEWSQKWGYQSSKKNELQEKWSRWRAEHRAQMPGGQPESDGRQSRAARIGKNIGGGLGRSVRGIGNIAGGASSALTRATAIMSGSGALGGGAALISSQIIAPGKETEQLEIALRRMKISAADAKRELAEVAGYKLNFSIAKSQKAFVSLRKAGIKPTEQMMQTLGDAAAAESASIAEAAEAVSKALMGKSMGLAQFGIQARKTKKYMEYSFVGDDGRMKMLRAHANNKASQEKALFKILSMKNGGAMAEQADTWDGLILDMHRVWEGFAASISDAGLFDFMKGTLRELRNTFAEMEKSGALKELSKGISSGLIEAMKVGWEVSKSFAGGLMTVARALMWVDQNVMTFATMGKLLAGMVFMGPLMRMNRGVFGLAIGLIQLAVGLGDLLAMAAGAGKLARLGGVMRMLLTPLALLARAFVAAGIAMMTTPIGWIIAGIAAVAAAAYLIYANWDKVGPWFAALWNGIKDFMVGFWNGFVQFLSTVGGLALKALELGWDGITALFNWTPLGLLINNWGKIVGFFGDWGGTALKAVQKAFEAIEDWVGGAVVRISETFNKIAEGIGSAYRYVFGGSEAAQQSLSDGLTADPAQLAAVEAATAGIRANMDAIAGADTASALSRVGGLSDDAARASEAIGKLTNATSAAIGTVQSMLARVSLQSHGVAMMATLAAGIRAGAGQAVAAVRETTQAMRDYLPHSPAKVGPLSDLHRVRFSETLASSIRPGPAIAAVRNVAAGMAAAIPLSVGAPVSAGLPVGSGNGGFGSGSPTITINYSPTVSAQGGADAGNLKKLLRENADEIARLVEEAVRRKERLQY